MHKRTSPLSLGDTMPTLDLKTPQGASLPLPLSPSSQTLVYFMRTSTCPVCHAHLRSISRARLASEPLAARTVVIVPGDAKNARRVESRHPGLVGRVYASESAHESVGLFVNMGLQQSGTFVVTSTGRVVSARTATVPLGSYNEAEALAALAGAGEGG